MMDERVEEKRRTYESRDSGGELKRSEERMSEQKASKSIDLKDRMILVIRGGRV